MKLLCSILLLLLYLAVTGRSSDAQLLQQDDDVFQDEDVFQDDDVFQDEDVFQDDDVFLHHSRTDELGLQLAAGTTSIEATWDDVTGASYYNISWTPGDNGGTDIVNAGNNTEYNISGLVSCTNYTVTVQPRNSESDVGVSETKSTTTVASDPGPVTNIKVDTVPDQSSQLAVSWPKAEGAGNCAITYSITWTTASGGGGDTTSNLSYTITGLAACTTYSVCVAATTDGGHYTNDQCSSGTTDEDKPGPVSIIDLTSLNDSSLYVRWEAPDKPNGVITQYRITWTWEDDTSHNQVNNTSYTSYTITDLHPCTIYTVTVSAATSKGFGVESAPQSTTTDSIAPDPPEVTAVMVVDESQQLSVSWTQPDPPGLQCPVTRYNVTWYLASTNQLVNQTTTSDTNLTIRNLEAWTKYNVCVTAATQQNNNEQKYSEPNCTLTETDQATPGPTSGTTIISQTARSMLVVWDPPEEPRGIITNYSVTWSTPDTNDGTEATVDGSTTQYNITSLAPCVTYTVTVTAATCKGYGERHDDQQVNGTTEIEAPPSPSVTCEEVVSPHQATVTWPPVITTCTVSGYTVNYTGDVLWSDDTRHNYIQLLTTYADLSDLTPWTTYTVCVAGEVVNDIVGAWSCCNFTTLEAAPGKPAEINLTSSSTKSVTLTWVQPETLNGVLTGYQLTWDDSYANLTANTTNYTISDLHRKSQYNITLKAGTAAGWGSAISKQVTTMKGVSAGAVVGGVVGGLLLVSATAAAVFYRKRLKDKDDTSKHTRPAPPMPMIPPVFRASDGDIKKSDLRKYIQYLERDTERGLEEEFARIQLQSPSGEAVAANREYNRDKNRFRNIYPYDNARVKLSTIDKKTGSDYINASYMKDIDHKPFFIAAQGPMPSTTVHFWRMVWEQRVHVIVMLTNLVEKGREKCVQYWPRMSEPFITAGKFTIRNHTEEGKLNHAVRFLEVSTGGQKRLVKQYHFTGWPDFGAPENVNHLLDFMAEVKSTMPTNGDHLLVHCSAGVGRTGTFITLWNLIDSVDSNRIGEVINIKEMVLDMRQYRPHMVQALDQYLYLFKCIATYIETPYKWNMAYAGGDHIYDNTAFQNDDHIYDNTAFQNDDPIYDNM